MRTRNEHPRKLRVGIWRGRYHPDHPEEEPVKNSKLALAIFAGLVATAAMAGDDERKSQPKDSTMEQRAHDDAASAHGYQNPTGTDPDPRMTNEVQENWREEAKQRREAEMKKPEQH